MTSVLVVDDDAQLRRALVRSLRVNGYESGVARSYEEALECVQQHSYDVVLTDLRMAGRNGIELVGALSELVPLTKAILMSAFASARDSQRALDQGAVGILCKPFDTVEMLRVVDRAAESRSGFTGSMHGLSLLDMLQMFHGARRSLTLIVTGSPSGIIHMQDGQVVHATHGAITGGDAMRPILEMPAGSLETRALEHGPTSVTEEFSEMVERLLTELPASKGSVGLPSDVKSIIEGAKCSRNTRPVVMPPDPPFPDVFGGLESLQGVPSLSAPPTLGDEGKAEFEIAQDIRRALPGSTACAVLALREGGAVHWSGNAVSELPPLWLNAVRNLLSEAPTPANDEVGLPLTTNSLAPGELQLGLPQGTLLGKVTRARRSAILLVVSSSVDSVGAWAHLRQALHEHEHINS